MDTDKGPKGPGDDDLPQADADRDGFSNSCDSNGVGPTERAAIEELRNGRFRMVVGELLVLGAELGLSGKGEGSESESFDLRTPICSRHTLGVEMNGAGDPVPQGTLARKLAVGNCRTVSPSSGWRPGDEIVIIVNDPGFSAGAGAELCNGIDNDCDGNHDETFESRIDQPSGHSPLIPRLGGTVGSVEDVARLFRALAQNECAICPTSDGGSAPDAGIGGDRNDVDDNCSAVVDDHVLVVEMDGRGDPVESGTLERKFAPANYILRPSDGRDSENCEMPINCPDVSGLDLSRAPEPIGLESRPSFDFRADLEAGRPEGFNNGSRLFPVDPREEVLVRDALEPTRRLPARFTERAEPVEHSHEHTIYADDFPAGSVISPQPGDSFRFLNAAAPQGRTIGEKLRGLIERLTGKR